MVMKLSVEKLGFRYGRREILKEITLALEKNEVLTVVGPNGSGKSTFLKCMDRILKPYCGTALLDGKGIDKMGSKELAREIGYVPQSAVQSFPLTVFDAVLLGRKPYMNFWVSGEDREKVSEAMELTGIESLSERYFDELSGGEKQRVLIARVVAQETKVLLLDEPTSNLDIRHQLEILTLVRNLGEKRELSVIIAIHDLNLASRFSDRIVMLKDGEVFAVGEPENILTNENISSIYGVAVHRVRHHSGAHYVIPV